MELNTSGIPEPEVWFGSAVLTPAGAIQAGSYGTWQITCTVGRYGLDNGGRLKIALRNPGDWGPPQTENPAGDNYVSATASNPAARLTVRYDPKGHYRPWFKCVVITVHEAPLAEGDRITVTFGDRSGGGRGLRAQSFVESGCQFRVLVECFETHTFALVPGDTTVPVISGPPHRLVVLGPGQVRAGAPFAFTVKAEDRFGNPAAGYRGTITCPLLAEPYTFTAADRGMHRFEGVWVTAPGWHRITAGDGALAATGNPLEVLAAPGAHRLFWGDIHGQTSGTIGVGSVDEYFRYARDAAALDYTGHNGNDFQITGGHYAEINALAARYHEPGRFVTFPGFEWSGNTPAGGDHNVFWLHENMPIHRSSHWAVPDKTDVDADRYPITELYRELKGKPALVVPHVGGRMCNLAYHEPTLEPVIEICSVHGRFEWLLHEALERGYTVGVVGNSDDHTGRPGATYGTSASLAVRGGLTGCYARELTREAIWAAYFARRTYATTGERISLWVEVDGHPMGALFRGSGPATLAAVIHGTAPVQRVEVMRNLDLVYSHPLTPPAYHPDRVRFTWTGARIRSRGRHCPWDGGVSLATGRITGVEDGLFPNPRYGVTQQGDNQVTWRSLTVGDIHGLTLVLDAPGKAPLTFKAGPADFAFTKDELVQRGAIQVDCGGVGQQVRVEQVPLAPRPERVAFTWTDSESPSGRSAYWLRITQVDGEMAWTSPVYVER